MKMGKVTISPNLIGEALGFPPDWKLESIKMDFNDQYAIAVISGSDFPEATSDKISECEIIIHKEHLRFEVKEIPNERYS